MFGLGAGELIAIVLVIFLLFGATRLPQLAKSLGQSRKALRDAMREANDDGDVSRASTEQPPPSINSGSGAAAISDDEIKAEMLRRIEAGKKT